MIRGNRVGSLDPVPQVTSHEPCPRFASDPILPVDPRSYSCLCR